MFRLMKFANYLERTVWSELPNLRRNLLRGLHGMELLYGIAHPKSVKLPMFDLEDQVSELTKVYVRKPRYVQWMTDAILGAM